MARGVHTDGRLAFYGWGRQDLGQFVTEESSPAPAGSISFT